jgi:hypothetical protein
MTGSAILQNYDRLCDYGRLITATNTMADRFKKKEERPSTGHSGSSVLSANNWRKIERLVRSVMEEVHDKKRKEDRQKLSHSMHHLAVQASLLKTENERLREALINEKRKRKRGKALIFPVPQQKTGGATFYSPKKIQQARELAAAKEAEREAKKGPNSQKKVTKTSQNAPVQQVKKKQVTVARMTRSRSGIQKQPFQPVVTPSKSIREASNSLPKDAPISIDSSSGEWEEEEPSDLEESDVDYAVPTPAWSRRDRQPTLPARYRQ